MNPRWNFPNFHIQSKFDTLDPNPRAWFCRNLQSKRVRHHVLLNVQGIYYLTDTTIEFSLA